MLAAAVWGACATASVAAQGTLPPLIDRELFFGNPEIASAQLSPDGKFIAFRKPYKETMNIWVKRAGEPFTAARLLTNEAKRPIPAFFWSRDGRFILFVKDNAGDENFNVYAVDPNAMPATGADAPAARNITQATKVRAFIYAVPKSEPNAIYVGLNDRDPAWHDLYKVDIATGRRTLIRQNSDRITGWLFDNRDRLRLATRTPKNGDTEVLRIDSAGKFTTVYSCTVFEVCAPLKFHADNRRVYLESNKGADADLSRLVLFDPEALREEVVDRDPLRHVDLENAVFSDITHDLLFTTYVDDRLRYHFRDKTLEGDYRRLQRQFPHTDIRFTSSTADEMLWLITVTSSVEPGVTVLFDRRSKHYVAQYRLRDSLERDELAEMIPIHYRSADGFDVPAYLTLPNGVSTKGLPVVIVPHGGPWARDRLGFNPMAQFLANRGYAVLQPNFRGSTGYGKTFLDAGNGQWGDRMQQDLTAGAEFLISNGTADPKRIGIFGGSYGGYATLAGVTFTPDLYAAAVAYVAPSNLITLLETIPPYWEAGRATFYKRMGDPTTAEGKAQLVRQSPLTHATRIKTPLLVVQGANDPRVNKRESDQIVIALRDRGFPVEYIVADDEGHGFARPVNNMAMFAAAEKFLAKHLGGRYQESMPPAVAKRLQEITVDPKTVQAPAAAPAVKQ
ncbi:MAG: S9 family peptidase [Gemmatimonadaceae bacterium]